jgi:Domain of unknown function (DUF397)
MDSGWRVSRYSGTNGNCVETASGNGVILIRDTQNRDGGMLTVTPDAWQDFAARVRNGSAA